MARLVLKNGVEETIVSSNILLQADKDIDFKLDSDNGYITLPAKTILKVDKNITLRTDAPAATVVYFKD